MAFTAENKYLDSARLRNIAIQSQLQVRLDQLKHDSEIIQLRITKQQSAMREKLYDMRIESGLQKQTNPNVLAKSILQSQGIRHRLNKDIDQVSSRHRVKSATPSITLDQFDRRLRQWRRERTAFERQACCLHVDPRNGTPCFVPNVETAYLSGGFHISLYQ